MKIALITDTHHGVRNDAPEFLDNFKKFADNVFLPYLQKNQIKQVIHLGDILDRRKYVAFTTARRLWSDFLRPTLNLVDRFDLIYGNHDEVHKNTADIAGPMELYRHLQEAHDFRMYSSPEEVLTQDGIPMLYLPWINDENQEASLDLIKKTKAQVCMGHLELEGFEMNRGQICEEGMSSALFNKFDVTCSGHFHHRSSKNGIHYLGSHGQFTWADYNDERGFHVFDTKTRELEFIENPYTMFEKVHYDEGAEVPDVEGKYVKVIVQNRDDQILFEQFISDLEAHNPADIQVVDDHLNAGDVLDMIEDEIDESEDTLSIFKRALSVVEGEFDVFEMEKLVTSIYEEAQTLES